MKLLGQNWFIWSFVGLIVVALVVLDVYDRSFMSQRVVRGATLLDKLDPGWENKIDLNSLDVSSVTHCVAAQLYDGNYFQNLRKLGLYGERWRSGFKPLPWRSRLATNLWKSEILARRLK